MISGHKILACCIVTLCLFPGLQIHAQDDGGDSGGGEALGWLSLAERKPGAPSLDGLTPVSRIGWGEAEVRRVLHTFAWGGQASDRQIQLWSVLPPEVAIVQMLNFAPVNLRLSPLGRDDPSSQYCGSITQMQEFWSSNDPENPMRVDNRDRYQILARTNPVVSQANLYRSWARMIHTPGCNAFAHKMALYITNYHASIHIQNTRPGLIRAYYDDVMTQLGQSGNFIDLMNLAASHAALSRAYGHSGNRFNQRGEFSGNDDFAREYFQLLFGIQGTSEDEDYHENVSIEHNAWLLSGMILDAQPNAWGSERRSDWLVAPIQFSNHTDAAGRYIPNQSVHYRVSDTDVSCLEILHSQICGTNAKQKLDSLGPVAAAHPESMDAIPLKLIRFFGDDRLSPEEISALRMAWAAADFDMLGFLQAYAISTMFLEGDAVKLRSAFDRNLVIHNANQISVEEFYSERTSQGPTGRMAEQGAVVFAPIRDVFGSQTGNDVANDRFVFKSAWDANVTNPNFIADTKETYRLAEDGSEKIWRKKWSSIIPTNKRRNHVVSDVGEWLWQRFVGDDLAHYDDIARAQVHALLATGVDFGMVVDQTNPDAVYSSSEINSGALAAWSKDLGRQTMDLSRETGNQRIGLAVNFITALPFSFAVGGQ